MRNILAKLGIVAVAMILAWPAFANTVMDRVETCNRIATGALLRIQGFGAGVKWVPQANWRETLTAQPKDSMYLRDDGETPDQRKGWEEPLQLGWKMQDAYIQRHANQPQDPKEILEACMKQSDAKTRVPHMRGRLVQVSQNEHLGDADPSTARLRECDFLEMVLHRAAQMKGSFDSPDAMLTALPFPDDWSDNLKTWMTDEVRGLFGFIGGNGEYIRQRHMVCLHRP